MNRVNVDLTEIMNKFWRAVGGPAVVWRPLVADQIWKGVQVAGHLQSTAKVPLSKMPNPQILRVPV